MSGRKTATGPPPALPLFLRGTGHSTAHPTRGHAMDHLLHHNKVHDPHLYFVVSPLRRHLLGVPAARAGHWLHLVDPDNPLSWKPVTMCPWCTLRLLPDGTVC